MLCMITIWLKVEPLPWSPIGFSSPISGYLCCYGNVPIVYRGFTRTSDNRGPITPIAAIAKSKSDPNLPRLGSPTKPLMSGIVSPSGLVTNPYKTSIHSPDGLISPHGAVVHHPMSDLVNTGNHQWRPLQDHS